MSFKNNAVSISEISQSGKINQRKLYATYLKPHLITLNVSTIIKIKTLISIIKKLT